MIKNICIVTGSRAEYGLLQPLMEIVREDKSLNLQVIVTGMHLCPEFGLTYKLIEADGFSCEHKIETILAGDSPVGVLKSMGLGIISLSEVLSKLNPDIVIILGDRFEIFTVAQCCLVLQIPLAHIAGGDSASGTYDNTIRHCITKIANLHFVTNAESEKRVIQLGENRNKVFNYGSTAIDNIKKLKNIKKCDLFGKYKINPDKKLITVSYHPITMGDGDGELTALLHSLSIIQKELNCSLLFTKANADNGGRKINKLLGDFVGEISDSYLFDSLGQSNYLNFLAYSDLVVGNSSSGIYEAPYLKTPTVNVGNRQFGRFAPKSVFHAKANSLEILEAMRAALSYKFNGDENLYGDGYASEKIILKIKEELNSKNLIMKHFFDL